MGGEPMRVDRPARKARVHAGLHGVRLAVAAWLLPHRAPHRYTRLHCTHQVTQRTRALCRASLRYLPRAISCRHLGQRRNAGAEAVPSRSYTASPL